MKIKPEEWEKIFEEYQIAINNKVELQISPSTNWLYYF